MAEIKIDILTSGDAEPIKKVTEATGALNAELAKDSNGQAGALDELSAAAKTAEDALSRVKEASTSLKDAFDPNVGLATPAGKLPDAAPTQIPLTVEDVGAIEKASAQLERKIAVMQALNEETAKESALLDKLNAALATEEAQAIKSAQADERRAAAKKKLEEAAKVQSFKVDSEAGVAAVEKEVAATQRKIITTRAAGESAAELEARLAKLNAALATEEAKTVIATRAQKQHSEAQQEAARIAAKSDAVRQNIAEGDSVRGLTDKKRALRDIAQGVAYEVPILGRAINLLTSPISLVVGGVAILINAFNGLKNYLSQGIDTSEWNRSISTVASEHQALLESTIAFDEFIRGLERVSTAQDQLKTKTDEAIKKLQLEARLLAEIAAANKEKTLAGIDDQVQKKKITPQQAEKARGTLEKKSIEDQAKAELALTNKTIALKQQELKDQQEIAVPSADDLVRKAKAAEAAAKVGKIRTAKNVPLVREVLGENENGTPILNKSGKKTGALGKLEELQAEHDALEKGNAFFPGDGFFDRTGKALERKATRPESSPIFKAELKRQETGSESPRNPNLAFVEAEIKDQEKLIGSLRGLRDRAVAVSDKRQGGEADAKSKLSEAESKRKQLETEIQKLGPEIEELKSKADFQKQEIEKIVPIRKSTIDTRTKTRVDSLDENDEQKRRSEEERRVKQLNNDIIHGRRSRGSASVDIEGGPGVGEAAAIQTEGAGKNIASAMEQRAQRDEQTAGRIDAAGKQIADALKAGMEPAAKSIEAVSGTVAALASTTNTRFANVTAEMHQLRSQLANRRV